MKTSLPYIFLTFLLYTAMTACSQSRDADERYNDFVLNKFKTNGIDITDSIYAWEETLIQNGFFQDHSSASYVRFIDSVEAGVFSPYILSYDYNRMELLNLVSIDSNSFDTTGMMEPDQFGGRYYSIVDSMMASQDISPKNVARWTNQFIPEKCYDLPSYRIRFFRIFPFLFDQQVGLRAELPPYPEFDIKQASSSESILKIHVSSSDSIFVNGEVSSVANITLAVRTFIWPIDSSASKGYTTESKIVGLTNDRGTSYQTYVNVYNAVTRAYNEVRDQTAQELYSMNFSDLEKEQASRIRKIVPMKIAEGEPVEYHRDR